MNNTSKLLNLIIKPKKTAERLFIYLVRKLTPQYVFCNLISRRDGSHVSFARHKGKLIRANDGENNIVFYAVGRAGRYRRNGIEFVFNSMIRRYVPDWFELRPDGIVIDVGANIGEFSMAIAPRVGHVVAVEPDKLAYACLKENAAISTGKIFPHNEGISNKTGKKALYMSSSTADTSFVVPEKYDEVVDFEAITLVDFVRGHGIEVANIDLIKIEAEGYEPEVLEGCLPDLKVKYFSVNCDPERMGQSPINEVCAILEKNQYTLVVNSYMVYGVLKGQDSQKIKSNINLK